MSQDDTDIKGALNPSDQIASDLPTSPKLSGRLGNPQSAAFVILNKVKNLQVQLIRMIAPVRCYLPKPRHRKILRGTCVSAQDDMY